MRQIDLFVDSVYHNVYGNKKEINELKEEMKNHLLEAVHELMKEGKSDQEAVDIAIERFGGEKEMRSIVSQLFKAQKIFAKRVLYIAMAVLVLSLIVSGALFVVEEGNSEQNSVIATTIYRMLENKTMASAEMEEAIIALVKKTDQISQVQIFKTADVKTEEAGSISYFNHNAEPIYQYDRMIWGSEKMDYYYAIGEEWFLHFESKHFAVIFDIILTAGIAIYAVLFTIWATINAYHHKRLNVGWILAFALLNIIGYLVYWLIGRKVRSNPIR